MRKKLMCYLLIVIFLVSVLPNKIIFAEKKNQNKKNPSITRLSDLRKNIKKKEGNLSKQEKSKIIVVLCQDLVQVKMRFSSS